MIAVHGPPVPRALMIHVWFPENLEVGSACTGCSLGHTSNTNLLHVSFRDAFCFGLR